MLLKLDLCVRSVMQEASAVSTSYIVRAMANNYEHRLNVTPLCAGCPALIMHIIHWRL
jgi:hypothetical protein